MQIIQKMGPFFIGGKRVQRGKDIGGLLRLATKLLRPVGTLAAKALKSDTGKRIVDAVKNQAIDSSLNIAKDLAEGKNIKETFKNEFDNVKDNTKRKAIDIGVDLLRGNIEKPPQKKAKKIIRKATKKSKKSKRRGDIFD